VSDAPQEDRAPSWAKILPKMWQTRNGKRVTFQFNGSSRQPHPC
jgi:hypothetical protein